MSHYPSLSCLITGWRKHIGCLKLQVILRERATNYRALLRNTTYEDKAFYDSTPPCTRLITHGSLFHVSYPKKGNETRKIHGRVRLRVTWLIHMCASWLSICVHHDSFMSHYPSWGICVYVWHDSFICVTWLIHACDMTPSYVWHDSFICGKWLFHMWGMNSSYVWHDGFICVTWLIHMCNMTCSYVGHVSFIRATWLIHMCDMTHSNVWRDSFIWVPWLVGHNSLKTHDLSMTRRGADACVSESCHTHERCMSHIRMWHVIIMKGSRHTYECGISHIWKYFIVANEWVMYPAYEWVLYYIWMRHVTHMNVNITHMKNFHRCKWMSHVPHVWMSAILYMNASCHTYECEYHTYEKFPSLQMNESCAPRMNECYITYECVMSHIWMWVSHIWMGHVKSLSATFHTYEWVVSHV